MIEPKVYQGLGLTDQEYKQIEKILGREPSLTELAMFSVEWSEHCGYSSSKKYLKLLPKEGKYTGFVGEDSGGIVVDDLAVVFKMESHNHPSQVEPKQGAATGVGGIIRDIFTAGARPVASLDSLRFGPLSQPYNKYLLKGVVDGIQFYGNCLGVPTVGGEIYFDESYSGNCLVNAMNIGVTDKNKLARAQAGGIGNPIMYVGASTGRDGIGGCSVLASAEFSEGEEKRPTVQIGDPFMEKCLIEATLETLDTGYVIGIKDMGAAGLTCSISEMAFAGGVGMDVVLDKVPLREKGMKPWEIMMSESQERMLVCVEKGKEAEIKKIFDKWELNAVVIGHVTEKKNIFIKYQGEIIADIPADSLTCGKIFDLPFEEPEYIKETRKLNLKKIKEEGDYDQILLELLAAPSLASKHWVYEQYDHMVQTNTMVLPGSDAAVIRLKGTDKALAATTDCNSRYCYLNPFLGSQISVAEAARNIVCSGGEPAAVTDCLNFGNPNKPDRYWQFKNCIEGIIGSCKALSLPVISGNVSFYNESPAGAINPTPTIGMVGVIHDRSHVTTQTFKDQGDVIILLGETKEELGGSEYLKKVHGKVAGDAPELDLDLEQRVQKTVLKAIQQGLVKSAHDCSEGGLAVALAETCISDRENFLGAEIDLPDISCRKDAYLFGETQSRIIVSCSEDKIEPIKNIAGKNNVPCAVIGKVTGDRLKISLEKEKLIDLSLSEIHEQWYTGLETALNS